METSRRAPPADPPTRLARIRVDANAIANNWRSFQQRAPKATVAAVVKADGYGLGVEAAARACAGAGARTFFTATTGEALDVRRALGAGPQIFVLNGVTAQDHECFAQADLAPVLNALEQIALWNGRGPAAVHIDTGMNRLGVPLAELSQAAAALGAPPALVMSHLACASDPPHEMNARQRTRFIEVAQLLPGARLSLAATAGALIGADYHFDMIRPGIGLYGSGGLDRDNPPLATVAAIEAPILQLREVQTGESFGYAATATASGLTRAATVALGYADGYLRAFGGRGYGVVGGVACPILGRISMDLTIIDVSACADARVGDWVEFLGPNAPLDDVAARAGTAPYELLTAFAGTVRRGART